MKGLLVVVLVLVIVVGAVLSVRFRRRGPGDRLATTSNKYMGKNERHHDVSMERLEGRSDMELDPEAREAGHQPNRDRW
ncbi:MAG TPA: hypothetical protein VGS21_12410 [Acidimicrobiales bacterium]|nr:hypothetical protein [Acidimicrobiales bacterium]